MSTCDKLLAGCSLVVFVISRTLLCPFEPGLKFFQCSVLTFKTLLKILLLCEQLGECFVVDYSFDSHLGNLVSEGVVSAIAT